jgi:hypothetical protein
LGEVRISPIVRHLSAAPARVRPRGPPDSASTANANSFRSVAVSGSARRWTSELPAEGQWICPVGRPAVGHARYWADLETRSGSILRLASRGSDRSRFAGADIWFEVDAAWSGCGVHQGSQSSWGRDIQIRGTTGPAGNAERLARKETQSRIDQP